MNDITKMTFEEYQSHLKTLPFFEKMATMKAYNVYFAHKVAHNAERDIIKQLNKNKLNPLFNEK